MPEKVGVPVVSVDPDVRIATMVELAGRFSSDDV